MSTAVYEASVYSREVTYVNFNGETRTVKLFFALDPLQLLAAIANFNPKTSRSANPAKRNQEELSDEAQIKFVRDICVRAAGEPTKDGEAWEPFPDFDSTLAGKAFLTKLSTSDGDRREFAEKVLLDPFRAFVNFAKADEGNSPADVQMFESTLKRLEGLFTFEQPTNESLDDRRARLAAELQRLNDVDDA